MVHVKPLGSKICAVVKPEHQLDILAGVGGGGAWSSVNDSGRLFQPKSASKDADTRAVKDTDAMRSRCIGPDTHRRGLLRRTMVTREVGQ